MRTSENVVQNWAKIKKGREGRKHLLEGVPSALPALLRATRVGDKARGVGLDWKNPEEVWAKVEEEMQELKEALDKPEDLEMELGDLLFAIVSLARHLHLDAESSLRISVMKFEKRLGWMEKQAEQRGMDLSDYEPCALDRLWNESKKCVC